MPIILYFKEARGTVNSRRVIVWDPVPREPFIITYPGAALGLEILYADNKIFREGIVRDIIERGGKPTVNDMLQILCFLSNFWVKGQVHPSLINDKTLEICEFPALPKYSKNIKRWGSNNGTFVSFPLTKTPASKAFTGKIGPSSKWTPASKSGCYFIYSKDITAMYVVGRPPKIYSSSKTYSWACYTART